MRLMFAGHRTTVHTRPLAREIRTWSSMDPAPWTMLLEPYGWIHVQICLAQWASVESGPMTGRQELAKLAWQLQVARCQKGATNSCTPQYACLACMATRVYQQLQQFSRVWPRGELCSSARCCMTMGLGQVKLLPPLMQWQRYSASCHPFATMPPVCYGTGRSGIWQKPVVTGLPGKIPEDAYASESVDLQGSAKTTVA